MGGKVIDIEGYGHDDHRLQSTGRAWCSQYLGADVLSPWHSPRGLPVHIPSQSLPHIHPALLP